MYRLVAVVISSAIAISACSSSPEAAPTQGSDSPVQVVRMITHESFVLSPSFVSDLRDRGIDLQITSTGDAGTLIASAILAAGVPTADLLFGVDNTLAIRATGEGVFESYTSPEMVNVLPEFNQDTQGGYLTPIDFGDVCINVDDGWFKQNAAAIPTTLEQLPKIANLLVVEDPATSSPGLAFLLATVARFGAEWPAYWEALRVGGVAVAGSWTDAYYSQFTLSGGDRPLVVSYATSPAAEVVFAEDATVTEPTTSVLTDSCYRQVEYAGVLAGAENPSGARIVIDALLSQKVQEDIPLNMFVYPVRSDATLPDVFAAFTPIIQTSISLPPEQVDEELSSLLDTWGTVMNR
jgi:thiamine transport system substrate-binding protein